MANNRHILSKSAFIRGWQCHKSLYLYKKRYYLRDPLSPEQQARFKRGTSIGKLARELFPGGVDASPPTPFQYARSVELTQKLVTGNTSVIYEAAFAYQEVLVALDILVLQDGKWYGYEVKSSLSISDTYMMDAALQYRIITGSGLNLSGLFIIYLNKDYVLEGSLELKGLFIQQDVSSEVLKLQTLIEQELKTQFSVVALEKSPAVDIGSHCNYPYPCDFQGHCWKHITSDSIFSLQWLSEHQKFDLYHKGILLPQNIPDGFLSDPIQIMNLESHRQNEVFSDRIAIREHFEKCRFPICFLWIWYYTPALPLFEGSKPYEKHPIFLSLGRLETLQAEMNVTHYLFDPGVNPNSLFMHIISEQTRQSSCILTFQNKSLELKYNELVVSDPDAKSVAFIDLKEILTKNYYYDPAFSGQIDLLAFGHKHLNVKQEKQIYLISETEAASEYAAMTGPFPETGSLAGKMKNASAYYLKCMLAFYHHLITISC